MKFPLLHLYFLVFRIWSSFGSPILEIVSLPAPTPKVVGGIYAQPGEFPYQLELVRKNGEHDCGAVLVSPILVLTAAHCVEDRNATDIVVVSGEYHRHQVDESEQRRDVLKIVRHENLVVDYNKTVHDIALLVLKNEFKLNRFTRPAVLARNSTRLRKVAIVTGWGRPDEKNKTYGDILKKAYVPLVPTDKCSAMYTPTRDGVDKNTLCAGGAGADSCFGDSGGPLTCIGEKGDRYLCGLVSWGYGCSSKYPGVYVDVRKYIEWAESQILELRRENICKPDTQQCVINYDTPITVPDLATATVNNPCSSKEFYCQVNKKCIPLAFRCDQDFDCGFGDQSDELSCHLPNDIVTTTTFKPKDTYTISPARPCLPNEYQCLSSKICIPGQFVCDGEEDCGHGDTSDELNCAEITVVTSNNNYHNSNDFLPNTTGCRTDQFECTGTKICIPSENKCNGKLDCGVIVDTSDEEFCALNSTDSLNRVFIFPALNSNCGPNEFLCRRTKQCIMKRFVCDGNDDCSSQDASDEDSLLGFCRIFSLKGNQ